MAETRHFPIFDQKPSEDFVNAWREHTDATGYPELFDKVSTAKPHNLADVYLLSGEIQVKTHLREGGSWVPCPLCQPNSPKFKLGRLAWFPHELTVLFIGNDCAKNHIGEDYRRAEERFSQESKCRRYIKQWDQLQERLPALHYLVKELLPIASALETCRYQLDKDASGFASFLYRELRWSAGVITVTEDSGLRDQHGRGILEKRDLGKVQGLEFLDGDGRPAAALKKHLETLEDIARPLPEWRADSDDDPATTDDILKRGSKGVSVLKKLRQARESIASARRFLDAPNLTLLERWAQYGESPFASLEFRREGNRVFLRSETFEARHYSNITIPKELDASLPDDGSLEPLEEY
ncbi:hypothetical protein QN219_28910 [Sinorhizobium sp. 7-81]|uniref:hypothetical protein n=1 Tax=Sinorhizobium sp. 8-89 TaxID=3049089 RepID=UPI0024C32057|nr:hypothetical protein [Sinorhizobium sp. 8-89]MDK1494007.1 hypothetical protein [Sinorhizobium sp. 8-89]